MSTRDRLLAVLVAVLWGLNFLAIHATLGQFPPVFAGALRFAVIAVPTILFVPWPKVKVRHLLGYGLGFGTGQFAFLFIAMDTGMPTGLASLVLQASAPFTVLLGAVFLRERVTPQQLAGIALAVAGMAAIAWQQSGHAAPVPDDPDAAGRAELGVRQPEHPQGRAGQPAALHAVDVGGAAAADVRALAGHGGPGRAVAVADDARDPDRADRARRPDLRRADRHRRRVGPVDDADATQPGRRRFAVLAAGAGGRADGVVPAARRAADLAGGRRRRGRDRRRAARLAAGPRASATRNWWRSKPPSLPAWGSLLRFRAGGPGASS